MNKNTVYSDDEICSILDDYFTNVDSLSYTCNQHNELLNTAIKYMFSNNLHRFTNIIRNNITIINKMSDNGLYLLHIACYNKKHEFITFLLSANANPNNTDYLGMKAIHHAIMSADSRTLDILISYNVDINIQDLDGDTALHYAVSNDDYEMVKTLINYNANPLIKNNNNMTAKDCSHNKKIIEKLSIYISK
jgi:ankyrin repeat protein